MPIPGQDQHWHGQGGGVGDDGGQPDNQGWHAGKSCDWKEEVESKHKTHRRIYSQDAIILASNFKKFQNSFRPSQQKKVLQKVQDQ